MEKIDAPRGTGIWGRRAATVGGMSSTTTRSPGALAGRDLSAQQAVVVSCVSLGAVTALDLADGRLGFLFSLGFILAVATAPMAVDVRSLLATGVMPPVLLIGALAVVAAVAPDAIVVEGLPADAGTFGRTLAAVIDHGITLVIGHVLALTGIAVRVATAPST